MKGIAKNDLPQKLCAACGRPFVWRHKWARDWDAVRYCSAACRTGRRLSARQGAGQQDGKG